VLTFRSRLRAVADGDDRTFLLGEDERILLVGRAHARVAALIDGRRSVASILADLAGELHPAIAHDALATLEARGYLVAVRPAANVQVAVRALADTDGADLLREALAHAGVEVSDHAPTQVVVVSDYLAPALEAVGREALAAGTTWWLIKLAGSQPWIGPVFRPGSPCWACLAHRLRANRPVERYLERRGRLVEPPPSGDPATRRAAAAWAALAIRDAALADSPRAFDPRAASSDPLRAFDPRAASSDPASAVDPRAASSGRLRVLDPRGPRVADHLVVRRPQCPACGDPTLYTRRASAPVVLVERPVNDGARTLSAAETFERHAHLVDPVTGVISSLGPVDGTEDLVWAASLFTHPSGDAASFDDFHATSMGKGQTPDHARVGALGEAIERISAAFQGDEPHRIASLRELEDASEPVIHPDALQLFSRSQFAEREAWNRQQEHTRRHVPFLFDPSARVAWTPAWSLTDGTRGQCRWLPMGYCYLAVPRAYEQGFFVPSSNGHAVGNCLEEAILQGLLELVERDAIAIWWYARVHRPGVELRGDFVERLAASGWTTWALDLTHDLGIPVRAALARDSRGRWCVGFGAHLDARVALARATGELRQLLVLGDERCVWNAGDLPDDAFLHPHTDEPRVTGINPPLREPSAAVDRAISELRPNAAPIRELRATIEHVVALLAHAGLETLVVDQTRPDLGLCAARVVVPGLRHFWPRFAKGRLYDVPDRLGWTRSLCEAELNPVPLFL
jgi:bacteriocin biosynthesis cyclodehydratase domain-containing protein